ncbi:MAG TPA: glycosyltransferase family 39 protein, partial [Coxiellaceae bacterium]|nr:glycosyltransferase family 39 protein [Coxiellaceae bacterium]
MKALKSYLLLALLCLVLYLPGLSSVPIIDRDEPHFAQTSRQMLETGRYWELKFQNEVRHLKPPGIYWLQALSAHSLSDLAKHEVWPYRLPSVFGVLFAVLLLYGFARRLLNESTAFWGAALLAASLLVVVEAHLSLTDGVLLFTVVLMQAALWKLYLEASQAKQSHWVWVLLFWGAMALGVLIKGVSPLFAILTILALVIADRKISWLKNLRIVWGVILLLGISLAWLLPFSWVANTNFLWDMIRLDLAPKLAGGQQSHGQPPGFFLIGSLITLWPNSLLLLGTAFYAWTQRKKIEIRFLLAWILPNYIVLELVSTKLPQYLLPIYPAVMLLMAAALVSQDYLKCRYPKLLRCFYMLWLLVSLALAAILIILPLLLEGSVPWAAYLSAGVITLGGFSAVILLWREKIKAVALILVLTSLFTFPLIFQTIIPSFNRVWLTDRIKAVLLTEKPVISDQHPLLAVDYQEPSLIF